jgi:hypothetical protein
VLRSRDFPRKKANLVFDADFRAFGTARVRNAAGEGRFGPVFTAVDVTEEGAGRPVVVRTVSLALTDTQRAALLEAFTAVCEAPLDHPGILKPLASGLNGDTPYIVHAWGAGDSLETRLTREGALPLDVLLPPLTRAAGAIDFAAAAGIHHGTLTPADIYLGEDEAAVAGFGLAQALVAAGIDVEMRNDVEALARIAYAAMGEPPLRLEVPGTALAFVAQLQGAHLAPSTSAAAHEPVLVAPVAQVSEPVAVGESPEPRRSGWPLSRAVAVALLAGAVGLAAGYVARDAADDRPIVVPAPTATSGSGGPMVRGSGGPAVPAPQPPVPSEPRPPGASAPAPGPTDPRTSEPSDLRTTLEIASRPPGAQVFVDGRLVGTTPLRQEVAPGSHAVRLALPAHRPWVTRVDVARGEQARVAGSLER